MNNAIKAYVIYYQDKYYKLLWELSKLGFDNFERRDLSIGDITETKPKKDLFFGYYFYFEELELLIFLYRNQGVGGDLLVNAKPNPDFILFIKNEKEDITKKLDKVALKISSIKGVQSVVLVDLKKKDNLEKIIYEYVQ